MTISTRFPRTSQPQGITPLNSNIAWATQFGAGAYLLEKNRLQSAISTSVFNSPAVTGKYGKSSPYVSSGGGGGVVGYSIPLTNIDSRLSATGDFTIIFAGKLNTLTDGATWTAAYLHGAGAGDSRTIGFTASAGTSYISFSNSVSYSVTNWSYAYTTNQEAVIVWVRKGSVLEIYVNGALYSSAAIGNIGTFTSAASVIGSAAAFYPAMSVSLLACSTNKALDGASLSANPWQLFAPIEKPIFSTIDYAKIRGPKQKQVTRTQQPQTHTGISNSSLAKGISFLWSPNSGNIDEVGINTIKYSSTSSKVFNDIVYLKTVRNNYSPDFITTTTAPHYGPASILVKGISLTLGGGRVLAGTSSAHIYHNGSGFFDVTISAGIRLTSSNSVAANVPYTICVYGSNNNYNIWVNGVITSSAPGDYGFFYTIDSFGGAGGDGATDLKVALIAKWNRQISVKEIEYVAANPWQLFAPIEQPMWLSEGLNPSQRGPKQKQVTRTSQPQTSVKINPKFDKLGITSAWIGSDSSREIVNNGITSTTGAGVSSNFTKIGKTAIFSSNTIGEHIKVAPNVNTLFNSEATILVFRRCLDTTSRENTVFGYNYDSGRRVSAHVPWSDGTVYFDFGTLDGVGRITAAGYTKDLLPEVLVFVAGSVKGREIWRRGSLLARNTGINGPRDTSIAATPFRIGATEDISSRSDLVEVALVVTANRAWSDAEIQQISANPWQLFAPIEQPLFLSEGNQIQNILIPPRFRQATRTTQPQGAVGINWSSSLSKGLKFAAIPLGGTWVDLVSGALAENTNNQVFQRTSLPLKQPGASVGLGVLGNTTGHFRFPIGLPIDKIVGPWTMFSESGITDASNRLKTFSSSDSIVGSGIGLYFDDFWSINNGFGAVVNEGAGGQVNASSTNNILGSNFENFTHRIGVSSDNSNISFYSNGSFDKTISSVSTPVAAATRRTKIGGQFDTGVTAGQAIAPAICLAWDRVLSAAEHAAIASNPWQLFAPIEKPIFLSQGTQAAPEAQTFNAAVTLSGLQVLSSIGVLTALGVLDVTTSLSGLEITSNVGTLSTSTAVTGSVTGLQMTASVGAAVGFSSATVTLDGRQASTALGALTAQTSAILTLTGVASVASHGVIGAVGSSSSTGVVLGIGTTAGIGTINATTSATYTLTGLVNAAQVGTIGTTTAIQTTLVGTGTTASRGTISSTGGASTTISGNGLTSNRGVLTVTTSVAQALGGLGTTSNVGTINANGTRSVSTTLVGQGSASNRGIITANTSVIISFNGVQVAVSTGTVSAAGTTSASTGLIGVEVTATLGNITAEGNFPYTISLRYYTVDSEDNIFIADSKSNEYVSESRNALVDLSANRNNVFVADSKSNEFTSDSRNSSLDASPARNIVFVSGSRNNIFTTITRDQ